MRLESCGRVKVKSLQQSHKETLEAQGSWLQYEASYTKLGSPFAEVGHRSSGSTKLYHDAGKSESLDIAWREERQAMMMNGGTAHFVRRPISDAPCQQSSEILSAGGAASHIPCVKVPRTCEHAAPRLTLSKAAARCRVPHAPLAVNANHFCRRTRRLPRCISDKPCPAKCQPIPS